MSLLELKSVDLSIGGKALCRQLNLSIDNNQYWALLGKNGVGKTSLLHSIMRFRPVDAGEIYLAGSPTRQWSRRELARRMGILLQNNDNPMPATVLETVLLGRHPHLQNWWQDDPVDTVKALAALSELELHNMADRQVNTLSGGEQQRLAIAMLIVQEPELFLLDEPSNHLDVAFQLKALNLLKHSVAKDHCSLLMASHDINLAARFCDWILLLLGEGNYLIGPKQEVLTEENLSQAYNCPIKLIRDGNNTLFFPA